MNRTGICNCTFGCIRFNTLLENSLMVCSNLMSVHYERFRNSRLHLRAHELRLSLLVSFEMHNNFLIFLQLSHWMQILKSNEHVRRRFSSLSPWLGLCCKRMNGSKMCIRIFLKYYALPMCVIKATLLKLLHWNGISETTLSMPFSPLHSFQKRSSS
jgi:hypothetical protein